MVLNLVERQRDCKSIEGQDIRELEHGQRDVLGKQDRGDLRGGGAGAGLA